jgi:ribosome biogenesis GTPase
MNGQVIRVISNLYTVKAGDQLYGCRARGKFRIDNITPIVGDNVVIDIDNNIILDILPRKNELDRPVIANVDSAIIVTSLKKPNLDLVLLDKLISIITYHNIEPAIVLTKADLISEESKKTVEDLKNYYEMIGINVFYNTELAEIKRFVKNKIVVLAGQTGAGKSSLLNRLDEDLNIETNEISEALGRGKHTTRHVELYEIGEGFVADTPGFSALDLKDISKEELKFTFVEFDNSDCKFRDCLHKKEVGCKVKEMVEKKEILQSRYDNYLKFLEELEK